MAQHTQKQTQNQLSDVITAGLIGMLVLSIIALMTMLQIGSGLEIIKLALPETLAWRFSRAAGVVGYLLLTASVAWGLLLSTRISKEVTPGPAALALHAATSWAAIAVSAGHALALLLDTYLTFNFVNLVVPFTGPYRPMWVGLGTIGFMMALIAAASFRWKKQLGHKTWRALHMLTFPAFGLVTVHGFMAGSDPINPIYVGSTLLVLFLVNYRMMAAQRGTKKKRT